MQFMMNQLGDKIFSERKRRGFTLKDVGDGIGTSGQYISQLEKGERKPSLENYLALIRFFGVEFSFFLDATDDDKDIIGREIKALREKNGWSIGDLRDKSGVDFFRIGRAEDGEIELSEEELSNVAQALGVDIAYFKARYDYNISKVLSAITSLGLTDKQSALLIKFIDDCLQQNKKHPSE